MNLIGRDKSHSMLIIMLTLCLNFFLKVLSLDLKNILLLLFT